MKTASKTIAGALAAALLTTAVATPAEARPRRCDDRRGGGISLGDVVLGTIAVAGVATVVGALGDRRRSDRGYDEARYDDRRYGRDGYADDERASIDACAYEAEREAGRRFGSAARVDIDNVDRRRDGYGVRGTVLLEDRYADSGYGRDRYYSRDRNARVAFTCTASYGRVDDLRIGSSYARGY